MFSNADYSKSFVSRLTNHFVISFAEARLNGPISTFLEVSDYEKYDSVPSLLPER